MPRAHQVDTLEEWIWHATMQGRCQCSCTQQALLLPPSSGDFEQVICAFWAGSVPGDVAHVLLTWQHVGVCGMRCWCHWDHVYQVLYKDVWYWCGSWSRCKQLKKSGFLLQKTSARGVKGELYLDSAYYVGKLLIYRFFWVSKRLLQFLECLVTYGHGPQLICNLRKQ